MTAPDREQAERCGNTIHSDYVSDHRCQLRRGHDGDCAFGSSLAAQLAERERALEVAGALVAEIPCQQFRTLEDCDAAVAQHMKHPERYEPVPRSEWCGRCKALGILSDAALAATHSDSEERG